MGNRKRFLQKIKQSSNLIYFKDYTWFDAVFVGAPRNISPGDEQFVDYREIYELKKIY